MHTAFSHVKVQGRDGAVSIPVTSSEKPEIGNEIRGKWQNIIDVMAESFNVSAGLVMRLDEKKITVFLASHTDKNPYAENDSETLLHGLYCETVVGQDNLLMIPDAREEVLWCKNPDIKLGMVSYLGLPIKWPDGEIFGTICVLDNKRNDYSQKFIDLMLILRDVLEKDLAQLLSNYYELKTAYEKLMENMRDLEKTKKELQHSLEEKTILLSEVHHRVKNNLQIISSLIDLQSAASLDKHLQSDLLNIRNRIHTMGLLHEILYRSKDFKNISIKEYITYLMLNLKKILGHNGTEYFIEIKVDENLSFNLDTAIPLGLIVNELVTNSFKHAFSKRREGKIIVEIDENASGSIIINISDNGSGMSDYDLKNPRNLGLEIVNTLVSQLEGTLITDGENGVSYSISLNRISKGKKRWQ